jgi:hypothetical protein
VRPPSVHTPTFASARTRRQGPCSRAVWPSVLLLRRLLPY